MNLEMHMQPQQTPRNSNTLRSGFRNEAELDELLDLVVTSRRRPTPAVKAAAAPAPEPDPEPAPKSLNDIFSAYLRFEDDLGALCAAQGSIQKLLFGADWSPIVDSPSTMGIYRLAESAITNMVRLAQNRFAPPGIALEINQHDALKAVGMDRWREEYDRINRRSDSTVIPPVDLDKLWAHLEATYGGDAGIELSHRQNGQTIIRVKEYGSNSGRYEPHYSYRECLLKLFKALASAFEWAEMDQLSIELAPARHQICDYDFSYKPRERVTFTGLEVVFFKEKFEFKFSHQAAEKLMLYLGTYGQA
jgi:hypothetical protein